MTIDRDTGTSRRRMRAIAAAAVLLTAVTAWQSGASAAQLIDRVLGVVAGSVITLSDARAVVELRLVDTKGARDPMGVALAWLVEQRLVLDEATRYGAEPVDEAAVEAMMVVVRRRFPSDTDWDAAEQRLGLTDDGVRGLLSDVLQAEQFVARRFEAQPMPSDADVQAYYEQHPAAFAVAGRTPPLSDVKEQVVARIRAGQRAAATADWLARLRRRADVSVLYAPAR